LRWLALVFRFASKPASVGPVGCGLVAASTSREVLLFGSTFAA
jgi:hypothetical protein